MNTEITNALKATSDTAQYDNSAKRLLGNKYILAQILVYTVDEFKGMQPMDVVPLIEGEPKIGIVPVEPGLTNERQGDKIIGLNTENTEEKEGFIRFDIVFYARMRDGLTQIIINVEAQKDDPDEYAILNRAIFYVSRMVSSQKERDFVHRHYNDIKKIYSIWVCMNNKANTLNHIHLKDDKIIGHRTWCECSYRIWRNTVLPIAEHHIQIIIRTFVILFCFSYNGHTHKVRYYNLLTSGKLNSYLAEEEII